MTSSRPDTAATADRIAAAAARPPGPGTIVWLASYPKSGNTWMRAIVTAMRTHRHLFAVNQLSSGSQPHHVGAIQTGLGIDPRWLDRTELPVVRDHLIRRVSAWSDETTDGEGPNPEATDPEAAELPPPLLRKCGMIARQVM